ncbi:hypothetical protein AURDEDRAFT_175575 [Auricularia subglabra TFB-10046 SS5]|uniref:F-box domain-containing protein n=1 Tax=Auricularia subglabra (strain TFB-10046 / SS5) TaxID=717982 RepID=J0D859_AURST|nr:hypothetical protein AURDEDRAFT_175575 [Auricularia subglabra TFB-10046 SS5]
MDTGGRAIPTELVYRILGFLPLVDLLRAMPVCQLWRAVAQDLPVYWRNIQLLREDASPAALTLAATRISCARSRPITVDIRLADPTPLLQLISAHLYHIADLQLHAEDLDAAQRISTTLSVAAPLLKSLWLEYYLWSNNTAGWPALNPEFLRGCPLLRRLIVHDFLLPPDSSMPVLLSLKFLSVRCDDLTHNSVAIPNLPASCPSLERLHLEGNITLGPSFRDESSWRKIDTLFLVGPCAEIYATLPVSRIRRVKLDVSATFACFQQLLSHIPPGPPFLAFHLLGEVTVSSSLPQPYFIRTRLSAGDHSIVREVEFFVAPNKEPAPQTVFHCLLDVASRAGTVLFSSAGWAVFVGFCTKLPATERLIIVLDEYCTHLLSSLPDASIWCPRLRKLELCRAGHFLDPWRVAPPELVRFTRTAVGEMTDLELCLSGIVIDGQVSDLGPTFSSVSYNHRRIDNVLDVY